MNTLRTFTDLGDFRGFNYVPPEPAVTLPQAILAALALALFIVGGLCWIAAFLL